MNKNDAIYNAHSYHTKVPYKAIINYLFALHNPGDIVLDGFSEHRYDWSGSAAYGTPSLEMQYAYKE